MKNELLDNISENIINSHYDIFGLKPPMYYGVPEVKFLVEKNITYKELSGMILMSETSLCRKLTGSRSLDLHTLISIVACLPDVSSEWLLRGKGRVCNSSSSISFDVLVEELKMENNLLKRKIQVLQELLEFKMEKIRAENGNIKK